MDPGGQTKPSAHGPLHAGVLRPTLSPYVPPGQLVHVPAPAKLYCPMGHNCTVGEVDPMGHAYPAVQWPVHVGDVSPGSEPKRPGRHGAVHVACVRPGREPYWPAGHPVHVPAPPREYEPAGHTTSVALVLPERARV